MSIDEKEYKDVLAHFPTGVAIVSTKHNNKLFGLTVNSFTSVSLTPPLVLFCIDKNAGSHNAFNNCEKFCINFLSNSQKDLALKFSSKLADKFIDTNYTIEERVPIISNSLSYLITERFDCHDAGDHTIIVGKVIKVKLNPTTLPLAYFNRKFIELY